MLINHFERFTNTYEYRYRNLDCHGVFGQWALLK